MADNVAITAGSGTTIATDDVGGVQYQRVKVALGADGAAADLAPGQAAMAASVPVVVASNQSAVPVSGTITANLSTTDNTVLDAIQTAVETIDNIVSGSEAQVDVVAALPAGTNLLGKVSIDQVTPNANEVVVKSGSVATVTVITNPLPSGTNAIGKLVANSGVDIGDVDILSIAAGTNLIGKVGIDQVTANANEVVVKSGTVNVAGGTVGLAASTNTIGYTKDAGPSWTPSYGVGGSAVYSTDMSGTVAVTDAPTSGQKIVIDDINISTAYAATFTFQEETGGTLIWREFLPASGGAQRTWRGKVKLPTADKKLMVVSSAAGTACVLVNYHSEA